MTYRLRTVERAFCVYEVIADSEQEARERLERGEWDSYTDVEHDEMEIVGVEER